jgi:hypothetical protein
MTEYSVTSLATLYDNTFSTDGSLITVRADNVIDSNGDPVLFDWKYGEFSFPTSSNVMAGNPVALASDGTISPVTNVPTTNADKWIGIAAETATAPNYCLVTILGGTNTSVSGLLTNTSYYLNYDGTLVNAVNTDRPNGTYGIIGRTLSATSILVNKPYQAI